MKYKVLLTGRYTALMDVFFTHMQENFECYSCSARTEDIFNHLKLFTPDALVYGLNKETPDSINKVLACKNRLIELSIPLIVIGTYEECGDFNISSGNAAKLTITRPFTSSSLTEKLTNFLEGQERIKRVQEDIREIQNPQKPQNLQKPQDSQASPMLSEDKKKILVVDDDPLMLKLIKEHLHEEYEVGTAVSGKVALKFLEKKSVDLILLDYEMPDEKGPEVLEKIHGNEATKDIPVLFLTGVTEKKKIQQALIQKPQGYILKPINKDKLMESIKKFV